MVDAAGAMRICGSLCAAVAGSLVVAASAAAQTDAGQHPYNGSWRADFVNEQGAPREGTVTIKGQEGTWDVMARSKANPCVGREAPVRIRKATADELSFEILRSKALAGCQDSIATLKRVDDKTLDGDFDGRKLKLTRK